jgi:hypothetical protein
MCFGQTGMRNSGNLQIHTGTSITVVGNMINSSSATLVNNGSLYVRANLTNDQASMSAGTGTLYFSGSSAQALNGSEVFKAYNLVTNNGAGITLNNNLSIANTHTFTSGLIHTSVTPNYLIYESGSSYSGAADSRHVTGWIKKIGSTDFTFPVGDNTYLRPVALESLSVSSEFNVKYNTTTPFQTQLQIPIRSLMPGEYWTINRVSGGSASVHLNWDNSKVTFPPFNIVDIRAGWYNGSNWTDQGGSATGNVTTTGDVTSNSVSSFGNFVIASTGYPLPLDFLSFTAQRKDGYSDLHWITANEVNTHHFEIERSGNGTSFTVIGTKLALNDPNINHYSYKDYLPVNGVAFYRIRCIDIEGQSKLSKIAAVYERSSLANDIKVLNPARGSIIIRSKIDVRGMAGFTLINEAGILVMKGNMQLLSGMDNMIALPPTIAKGTYFLRLNTPGKEFVQKIIVQ